MFTSFFVAAFWTLLPIVNPIGAVPPFLAMTARDSLSKRREIARRATFICATVMIVAAACGSFIFKAFGISLPSLKIAGGILLLLVSIDMIHARKSRTKSTEEEQEEGATKTDIAVFPLAVPLLSGPGAIASIFILLDKASVVADYAALIAAIIVVCLIVYAILREAHRVLVVFGTIGLNVLSRLMGLVLASIAVEFIVDGLILTFPAWAK